MALPTQKHTKSRKNKKKPHLALKQVRLALCPKCKKPILPHHACSFCGAYAGKEILKIKSKIKKHESHKH